MSRIPPTQYPYAAIAAELRSAIESGRLKPGDRLPSEHELAEQYSVHRLTARAAYKMLVNEGLVISRARSGRFVRPTSVMRWHMNKRDSVDVAKAASHDPWLNAVTEAGHSGTQTIEVKTIGPDTRVMGYLLAEQLDRLGDYSGSTMAVCRSRVRSIDGVPSELADSYYPYALAKDTPIMGSADIQPGIFPLLAGLGFHLSDFEDEWNPRMPTKDESARLQLPPATPVLEMIRRTYFTDGASGDRQCLLVRHTVYAGGGNRFVYQVSA